LLFFLKVPDATLTNVLKCGGQELSFYNPSTLVKDIGVLVPEYKVEYRQRVDMFPQKLMLKSFHDYY
jgi:hypothetical protein